MLADMHDCCGQKENELKRFKGIAGNQNAVKPIISLQHRLPLIFSCKLLYSDSSHYILLCHPFITFSNCLGFGRFEKS